AFELITFTFTGVQQYEMQVDTKYCIVFENPTVGTITTSHYIRLGFVAIVPAHDGNFIKYSMDDWTANPSSDCCFYVYGETIVKASLNITNPYPENNSIDICPCNDYMSIDIETDGTNNMNLSFYHSVGDALNFHRIETFYNITNGTYSFCMCGHSFSPAYINKHDNGTQSVLNAGTWYNVSFNELTYHPVKNIN
ncbi:unnamed protein product, partial [marine sediment metagenome]